MVADPLSDVLKTVRLTGAAYWEIASGGEWAVQSPAPALILPKILPGADHLIAYHVVTAGSCFATIAGGEPILLKAGEAIVFTRADSHVMSSAPGVRAIPATRDVIEIAAASERPFRINCGGDTATPTRLVCGYLACDARPFNPLVDNLPPVITSGDAAGTDGGGLAHFVRYAVAEVSEKRVGGETVLTKLSEVMFVDVLRRYIAALPPRQSGWLAGLRDPFIGRALSLLHGDPARNWTIEDLAKQIGQSRSVLAERFTEIVGVPPMHYLAQWRMQLASELLLGSNAGIARIAAEIGYESEAAFSRAFKKLVGVPPSRWRHGARTPDLAGE